MEVRLEAGYSVIFYTDGLPEARDLTGKEFGINRLQESVEKNSTFAIKKLVKNLQSD